MNFLFLLIIVGILIGAGVTTAYIIVQQQAPPVVVEPPVTNDTDPTPIPIPVNKPPVLEVDSPIKCILNLECTLVIESLVDPDGNITQIIWNQESGPLANINTPNGNLSKSAIIIPTQVGTYVFSVEAIDNNGSATLKPITVNVPLPPPEPKPVGETINVITVGDIYGEIGKTVAKSIQSKDPEAIFILGDNGYDSDGDYLNGVYISVFGNKIYCTIGNHDEAKIFIDICRNNFYTIKNHHLFIGVNTEGDFTNQANNAIAKLQDKKFMEGIVAVHVMSHFPFKAPPDSHHPEDEDSQAKSASAMIGKILNAVPAGLEKWSDNGHNHGLAQGKVNDVNIIQSGGGGRGSYDCGTNAQFPYCDNVKGFVEYTIQPNGDSEIAFYNANGGLIR